MMSVQLSSDTQQLLSVSDQIEERTDGNQHQLPIEKIRQHLLRIDTQSQRSEILAVKSTKSLIHEAGDHLSIKTDDVSNSSSSSSFDINDLNWNWKEKGERMLFKVRGKLQTVKRIFPRKVQHKRATQTNDLEKGHAKSSWLRSKKEKVLRFRRQIKSRARSAFRIPSVRKPKMFGVSLPNVRHSGYKPTSKTLKVVETLAKIEERDTGNRSDEFDPFVSVDTEYRALQAMFRDAEDLLGDLKVDVDVLWEVTQSKDKDDKRELAKVQRIVQDLSLIVQSITHKVVDLEETKKAHFEIISNSIDDHKAEVEEFLDEYFHFRDLMFLELENKVIEMLRRFDQQHAALFDAGSDLENMQNQKTLMDQLLDVIMGIVQITQGFVNHIVFLWLFHPAYRLKTFSWTITITSLMAILYGNDLIELNGKSIIHFAYFVWDVIYNVIGEIFRLFFHNFVLPTLLIPQGIIYGILGFLEYFLPTAVFRTN